MPQPQLTTYGMARGYDKATDAIISLIEVKAVSDAMTEMEIKRCITAIEYSSLNDLIRYEREN